MTFEEALRHCGHVPVETVEERAKAIMPKYLFMEGDEKHREGYCTACERWVDCSKKELKNHPAWAMEDPYLEYEEEPEFYPYKTDWNEQEFQRRCTGRAMHNDTGYCPRCGERVTFKHTGRGYKTLMDRRFMVRWQKSAIDPNTLVCRGYDLIIDWQYLDMMEPTVPMVAELREICVIPWGKKGDRFIYEVKWCDCGGWDWTWKRRKDIKSGWRPGATMFGGGPQVVLDNRSFMEAADGTPWATLLNNNYLWNGPAGEYYDRIDLMSGISRYPCAEYMQKLGYEKLAADMICGNTGRLLNPRGKTAKAVLRLTDDEWGEVKGKRLEVTTAMLKARKIKQAHNLRLSMEALAWIGHVGNGAFILETILKTDPGADVAGAVRYCMRKKVSFSEWRDQLKMMDLLGMDLRDKEWLYPRDFRRSHETLTERQNAILAERMERETEMKNAGNNAKISERLESGELDEYFFSANGLMLRPMFSAGEVVVEGSRQGHCVGGYVNTYASGNDVLCVLRYEDKPNEPLYTVEFGKDGNLVQCRAKRNGQGPITAEEREAFWKLHNLMRKDLRAQRAREEKNRRKSA